jgi:hypothetical protein
MRRFFSAGVGLLLVFAVSGCGGPAKHEAVIKAMLEQMNALGDALDSVKDRASAKTAAVKINAICDRMKELGKDAEKLPKLTKADHDKLEKKYGPELEKVVKRVQSVAFQAGANCGGEPDFLKAAMRLQDVGRELGKSGGK